MLLIDEELLAPDFSDVVSGSSTTAEPVRRLPGMTIYGDRSSPWGKLILAGIIVAFLATFRGRI